VSEPARHPWAARCCDLLEQVIVGRAAETLVGAGAPPGRARSAVIRSSVWIWRDPLLDVGRKASGPDGTRLLLPIRVSWDGEAVRLVGPGRYELAWSARGMGYDLSGSETVEAVTGPVPPGPGLVAGGTGPVTVGVGVRGRIGAELSRLAGAGVAARWELIGMFEPLLVRALNRAHTRVAAELRPNGGRVLSMLEIEALRDRMLLGEDDDAGHVGRLLERCLAPRAFEAVDPLRYVARDLARTAEEAVRRMVGDPKIGSKIRRVHAELGVDDIPALIAAYTRRYPGDRLGRSRAQEAIRLLSSPPAVEVPLDPSELSASALSAFGRRRRASA